MGLVHDIGKIGVPVRILNKAGRLTPAEYEQVKSHSQFGFDILDKLDFGWPVAECVLQHHERLDGSGYPRALKAQDIFFEARILAVADVIDAMSEQRTYRPALGIQSAMSELFQGRERLYDPRVVEAAARLFDCGFSGRSENYR